MDKKYTKTTWENGKTRLNATNLNHIEDGIETLYNEALDENSLIPGNGANIDKVGDKLRIGIDIVEVTEHLQASGYVEDPDYIHTDNNFTDAEKTKLDGIDMTAKQDTLVSGENIMTINGNSILGSGNMEIQTGSGGTSDYTQLSNKPSINGTTLEGNLELNIPTKTSDLTNDSDFATTGDIDGLLDTKQNTLESGINIATINGNNLLEGGNITITPDGTLSVIDNITTSDSTAALSASQGKELARRTEQIRLIGDDNNLVGNSDVSVYCFTNHKYRIHVENVIPDLTGVTVSSSAYVIFGVRNSTIDNTSNPDILVNIRATDISSNPFKPYYDVVTPHTGLLWILARATAGQKLNYWIEDITEVDNKIDVSKNTVNLFEQYFIKGANKYINTSGNVSTGNSVNSIGVSDYIDVHDLGTDGLYFSSILNSSVVSGVACYDENKTYISRYFGSSNLNGKAYFHLSNSSVYYIRLTFANNTDDYYIYRDEYITPVESPIYNYDVYKISPYATVNNNELFVFSPSENLLNPLKFISGNHIYINSNGAVYYSNAVASVGVTDFIPFGDNNSLKVVQNDFSGSIRNAVYDANYQFIRATVNATVNKNSDSEVYVRFSILSGTPEENMVCRGDYDGEFVPYNPKVAINPDMYELNITVDNITPTTEEFLSGNLCNPDECYFGNDNYISRINGRVAPHSTSSNIGGYTGFIPIDSKGLAFTNVYYAGAAIGGAVYNSNKVYIRSAGSSGIVSFQEGDAYVRFTLGTGAAANNVMVNKGTTVKDYVPYGGKKKVISPEILPSNEEGLTTYEKGVEVFIPDEVVITRGNSLQLFYRNMVKAVNPYAFNLQGTCSNGAPFPRYTRLDTVYVDDGLKYLSTGTRTFTMKAINNNSEEVAKATTTIKIIPNPTSPASQTNILLVGASTFAGGQSIAEINRRLTGTDGVEITQSSVEDRTAFYNPKGLGLSNISFVGRLTSNGVHHEAKSGRQIAQMVKAGTDSFFTFYFTPETPYSLIQGSVYSDGTRQFTVQGSDISMGDLECMLTSGSGTPSTSGTLTLVSGSGSETVEYTSLDIDNTNPFWNSVENKIDFQRYSTQYLNNEDINILIICLGINDMFNDHTTDTIVNDYKSFIRAYHNDYPIGKVIMFTPSLPDINGGMGISYGSKHLYWNYVNKYFNLWKGTQTMANDSEFSSFVKVCASAVQFDTENLYYKHTTKTSNRATTTEQIGFNALHYGEAGFNTMADSIYYSICDILQ